MERDTPPVAIVAPMAIGLGFLLAPVLFLIMPAINWIVAVWLVVLGLV